ncbi:MAG: hypothetical protein ACYDCO_13400 [Armatimonadota bacterium]
MKNIIIGIAILAVIGFGVWYAFGGSGEKSAKNKFGQGTGAEITPISQIVKSPDQYVGKVVTVEGQLTKECPTSGCWWYVKDDTGEIRADSFGGGFALPLNREGKHIRTTGKIVKNDNGDLEIGATGAELH